MTDFPDWQAPAENARQISVTGAPPLVFKQLIDVLIGQNIPASSSVTRPATGNFKLNQPGYEIELNIASLTNPAPIVSVELQWYDSSFGALMEDETYYFYSGDVNGHQIHGRGPSKADRVVVVITNHSGAGGLTCSYTLLQTSRTFTREFWHTITKGGVTPSFLGFTALAHNIAGDLVGTRALSVPASQTDVTLMPFYTGTVRLFGTGPLAVAAAAIQWIILATADPVAAANNLFQGSNGQSGFAPFGQSSLYAPDIALPRSQCELQISNTLTIAQNCTAILVAQEDRA